ncbi:MAG TPA: hypothetical protein VJ577_08565 [Burkholderiaceae bacterium]|nr:hypothetical protein [Burkholderiaceae bacterium]
MGPDGDNQGRADSERRLETESKRPEENSGGASGDQQSQSTTGQSKTTTDVREEVKDRVNDTLNQ